MRRQELATKVGFAFVNQLRGSFDRPGLTVRRNNDVIFWNSALFHAAAPLLASREDKFYLLRGINRINVRLCVC